MKVGHKREREKGRRKASLTLFRVLIILVKEYLNKFDVALLKRCSCCSLLFLHSSLARLAMFLERFEFDHPFCFFSQRRSFLCFLLSKMKNGIIAFMKFHIMYVISFSLFIYRYIRNK